MSVNIIKEEYDGGHCLLENIEERIIRKEYPVFVTAGNSHEKLMHIMHSSDLIYCYESLSTIQRPLITFGFNFGSFDEHIIEAVKKPRKV